MPDARARFRLEGENATGAAFKAALGDAQKTASRMQALFRTAFAGISVSTITHVARDAIRVGDDLQKAAIKAGLSGKAISELAHAAKMADVELGDLSNALRFMQTNLSQAATGGKAQTEALAALGLTFRDLKQLAPDQQFEMLADRISKLRDPADRARAATELFGRAGANLLPLFEQGAEGIRRAREEAERLGLSFSDEKLKRLADADEAIKRMTASFKSLAMTLTAAVAPALEKFFNRVGGAISGDKIERLKQEIEFLQRVQGESFVVAGLHTYQDIGTGFFSAEEGAAKLRELQKQLRVLQGGGRKGGGRGQGGSSPGYTGDETSAPPDLAVEITAMRRFDPGNTFRMSAPHAIDAQAIEATRFDQFGGQLQEILEGTSKDFDQLTESSRHASEAMQVYADESMRGVQRSLAQFFLDPARAGIKGLGKNIVDVFRDVFANILAAKVASGLFGSMDATGKLSGGLLSGAIGSLFGFASGGSFNVGGSGGTDSQVVAFRATPGEKVSVTPPGKSGSGIVLSPVYNVDARGNSDLAQALPAIFDRNNKALIAQVKDLVNRGRI